MKICHPYSQTTLVDQTNSHVQISIAFQNVGFATTMMTVAMEATKKIAALRRVVLASTLPVHKATASRLDGVVTETLIVRIIPMR